MPTFIEEIKSLIKKYKPQYTEASMEYFTWSEFEELLHEIYDEEV